MLIRLPIWRPIPKIICLSRVSTHNIAYHHFTFASSRRTKNRLTSFYLTNSIVLRHLTDAKDEKSMRSDERYSIEVEKQMDLERIRKMQKYFEQYTEEYVEMETESGIPCEITRKSGRWCLFFTLNSTPVKIDSVFENE